MSVILYTLPSCGICKMIKTKLQAANIDYTEKDLTNYAEELRTDHAPVLETTQETEHGTEIIRFFQPTDMIEWINLQG